MDITEKEAQIIVDLAWFAFPEDEAIKFLEDIGESFPDLEFPEETK